MTQNTKSYPISLQPQGRWVIAPNLLSQSSTLLDTKVPLKLSLQTVEKLSATLSRRAQEYEVPRESRVLLFRAAIQQDRTRFARIPPGTTCASSMGTEKNKNACFDDRDGNIVLDKLDQRRDQWGTLRILARSSLRTKGHL